MTSPVPAGGSPGHGHAAGHIARWVEQNGQGWLIRWGGWWATPTAFGGVTQLARVRPLQGRSRGFESHRLHPLSESQRFSRQTGVTPSKASTRGRRSCGPTTPPGRAPPTHPIPSDPRHGSPAGSAPHHLGPKILSGLLRTRSSRGRERPRLDADRSVGGALTPRCRPRCCSRRSPGPGASRRSSLLRRRRSHRRRRSDGNRRPCCRRRSRSRRPRAYRGRGVSR